MNIGISGSHGYLGEHLFSFFKKMGYTPYRINRDFSFQNDEAENIISPHLDIIINCAVCYGRMGETDSQVSAVNCDFGIKLLELAVKNKISHFINIGTSISPEINTYTFTKHIFSEWGKFYAHHHKINFIQLIFEHFYGPHETDQTKFVAFVINALQSKQKILELTAGDQLRDFIYIDDALQAVCTVIGHLSECIGYREIPVGSGTAIRIKEFVQMLLQLSCSKTELKFGAIPYRENETMYSCADTTILRSWGWSPKTDIKQGLINSLEKI